MRKNKAEKLRGVKWLVLAILTITPGFPGSSRVFISSSTEAFCDNLKTLLQAARNGFETVKGARVERIITARKHPFIVSKVRFVAGRDCYINTNEHYPECECILTADVRINDKLKQEYAKYRAAIKSCLSEGWKITEQDSANNFYLRGTEFRKLVAVDTGEGEKHVQFHLYMYSSMIEKARVVELKIEGIGRE